MRIAVATDDGVAVAAHTGRCVGFVICEIVAGQARRVEYRENKFAGRVHGECAAGGGGDQARRGAQHSHGGLLNAVGDCCAVISGGMGPRLVADLTRSGIDAYVCDAAEVDAAAGDFAAGSLLRVEGRSCPR